MNQPGPDENRTFWKRCSGCKKELSFQQKHYVCSVSTCRAKRTGYVFCSVPCWDAHLGFANHRSAFAEEAVAPSKNEFLEAGEEGRITQAPRRTIISSPPPSPSASGAVSSFSAKPGASPSIDSETLVVVSRVKKLVKDLSDFNTSECAIDALSSQIVLSCKQAVENAKAAGRKTVMGRDVK